MLLRNCFTEFFFKLSETISKSEKNVSWKIFEILVGENKISVKNKVRTFPFWFISFLLILLLDLWHFLDSEVVKMKMKMKKNEKLSVRIEKKILFKSRVCNWKKKMSDIQYSCREYLKVRTVRRSDSVYHMVNINARHDVK